MYAFWVFQIETSFEIICEFYDDHECVGDAF